MQRHLLIQAGNGLDRNRFYSLVLSMVSYGPMENGLHCKVVQFDLILLKKNRLGQFGLIFHRSST